MHEIVRTALVSQQEIPSLSSFIEGPENKIRSVKRMIFRLHQQAVQQAELCPELAVVGIWGLCKVFPFAIFGDFTSDAAKDRLQRSSHKLFVHRNFNQLTFGYLHEDNEIYLLAFLEEKAALALDPFMEDKGAKDGD